MTTPDTAPPGPSTGGGRLPVRPVLAALAAVALLVVPPSGREAWAGLGAAFLVLLVGLWPSRAPALAADAPPTGVAIGVGGAFMLLGLLVAANPWFGVLETDWPWVVFGTNRAWSLRADVVVWTAAGLYGLWVAVRRPRRAGPYVALMALGLFAAARGYAENAAFRLVRVDRMTFLWTAGACLLGGGLLHLASSREARRGLARGLVLAGVVAIVSVYLSHFEQEQQRFVSSLGRYAEDYARTVDAIVLGQEHDAKVRLKIAERAWSGLVPFTLQAVCLALSLLVAALPSRGSRRLPRYVAALAWLAMLLTWIVPMKAGLWFRAEKAAVGPWAFLGDQVADLMLRSGASTWLLVGGSLAALLSRAPGDGVPAWPRGIRRPYRPRWGYVAGAFLTVALAVRCFHPGTGAVLPQGVLAVLDPLQWDPATAVLTFLVILLLGSLGACLLPAGPGRGGFAAMVSLLCWAALTPLTDRDYGLESYVPAILQCVAVGAIWASGTVSQRGRSAARLTAAAAGILLLLLTVYPLPVKVPAGGFKSPFANAWMEMATGWEGDFSVSTWAVATAPWRVRLLVDTFVGLLALVFAIRGRPTLWKSAVAASVAGLAYTVLWAGFVDSDGLRTTVLFWGDMLRKHGVAMALVLMNAVRDLHDLPGVPDLAPDPPETRLLRGT